MTKGRTGRFGGVMVALHSPFEAHSEIGVVVPARVLAEESVYSPATFDPHVDARAAETSENIADVAAFS